MMGWRRYLSPPAAGAYPTKNSRYRCPDDRRQWNRRERVGPQPTGTLTTLGPIEAGDFTLVERPSSGRFAMSASGRDVPVEPETD